MKNERIYEIFDQNGDDGEAKYGDCGIGEDVPDSFNVRQVGQGYSHCGQYSRGISALTSISFSTNSSQAVPKCGNLGSPFPTVAASVQYVENPSRKKKGRFKQQVLSEKMFGETRLM